MTRKQKTLCRRILLSAVLYIITLILEKSGVIHGSHSALIITLLYLIPYVIVGYGVYQKAFQNLKTGRLGNILDEHFLMCIASVAAFCIGEAEEGVAAILFFVVGELFEDYAVNRSRESIQDLMSIAPEIAHLEAADAVMDVDPYDVAVGSTILVHPGEKVPLDGVVLEGESFVDTSALTGESVERHAKPGDEIISGCVNGNGLLKVKTTKEYDDSTVARILELVEDASSRKSPMENFMTKFARYYTPTVVILAVALAVILPLFFGIPVSEGVRRVAIFLVVSCPCALVISIPLSFFGGIGAASRKGILVKGSNFLEALARTDTFVFDKTGTLTKGTFRVTEIFPAEKRAEILWTAAACEQYSDHPIAHSIMEAFQQEPDVEPVTDRISDYQEIAGNGVHAVYQGDVLLAGNSGLMETANISYSPCEKAGTVIYISRAGQFLGWILIRDELKPGIREAMTELHSLGASKTVMLTGDRTSAAESIATEAGIDLVFSELLPGDKVDQVQKLMDTLPDRKKLAFAGDGINDAPVIMRADVGIAMGSLGSDAAIEAADVVLMDDDPRKINVLIRIANKTLTIAKENIVFALGVKFLVLFLGALGLANMWMAIFADVGVSILAILNAMRTLRIR